MAKKNLFNAETIYNSSAENIEISKKAVISYLSMVPFIEAHGRSMPLSNKTFGIGRDKSNAVIVSDPEVSKFHTSISFRKGDAYIKDLGSTNGTWINKKRLPDGKLAVLKNKDVIIIGNTQILFRCR